MPFHQVLLWKLFQWACVGLAFLLGTASEGRASEAPYSEYAGQQVEDAQDGLTRLLSESGADCSEVHDALQQTIERHSNDISAASNTFLGRISWVVERISEDGAPYNVLWRDVVHVAQAALQMLHLLSLLTMMHKHCFSSAARLALGRALLPLQKALMQQISTMWWMFDIGQYSNTNNPGKHLEAVLRTIKQVEAMLNHLSDSLPAALAQSEHFWGHDGHGMFINSTVIYRNLFPEAALVDKGLLRFLLKLLPQGISLGDFGALDGQYSKWLNDTGWVTAFAFDGVEGVSELTDGAVSQIDLAEEFHIAWRQEPFDWVLCLEVAEHIPPALEQAFLANLDRHAARGLVLSWAPPHIEGEGHVNCLPLEESRRRVEALGFEQDVQATEMIRANAHIPWIAASVAVYRRSEEHSG